MARGESKPSICWDCARACGLSKVQCSWFGREKTLPEGCEYEEKQIYTIYRKTKINPDGCATVYAVKACPQFLAETEELRAKLKDYRMAKLRRERSVDMAHRIFKLMLGRK